MGADVYYLCYLSLCSDWWIIGWILREGAKHFVDRSAKIFLHGPGEQVLDWSARCKEAWKVEWNGLLHGPFTCWIAWWVLQWNPGYIGRLSCRTHCSIEEFCWVFFQKLGMRCRIQANWMTEYSWIFLLWSNIDGSSLRRTLSGV